MKHVHHAVHMILFVLVLGVLGSGAAWGQIANPDFRYVASDPSGACPNATPNRYNYTNNKEWGCENGTWTQVNSGGGSVSLTGGTGISVSPNPITGTGVITNTAPGALPAGSATELQTKVNSSTFGGAYVNGVGYPINTLQVAAPSTSITAALAGAGAGNVDNGGHNYLVTFVNALGETTGDTSNACGYEVTVIDKTANGKVSLSAIPTGPVGVTARKIYRTIAGLSSVNASTCVIAQLLTTLNDNTTTTYLDNTADADLGAVNIDMNTTGFLWQNGAAIASLGPTLYSSKYAFVDLPAFSTLGSLNLLTPDYGNYLGIQPSSSTQGGAVFFSNSLGGQNPPFAFYATAGFDGTITSDIPSLFDVNYNALSGNALVNQMVFSVEHDAATFGGSNAGPVEFGCYNLEDGNHYQFGWSQAGGKCGINTGIGTNAAWPVPTAYFQVNGTYKTDLPEVNISRVAMQSVNMLQLLDSNMTTVLTSFDKNGSALILSDVATPFIIGKMTASAVAPGAGKADLRWVAGTNAGTCKLVANAGTSATEIAIIDNVGGGC